MTNLKYLRTKTNLSLRKLSEITKISHSTLQLLENEKRELKVETADQLADFYQVSLEFLIGKNNNGIQIKLKSDYVSISKEEYELYSLQGELKTYVEYGHVWRIPTDSLEQKLIKTSTKERKELYDFCENLTDEQIKEILDFIKKYIKK